MGIMMVTSLSSFAKNMQMAARWQERQEKSDFAPDKVEFVDKSFQNKVDEKTPPPKRSSQMEMDIEIKLTAGKKLSAEEMRYLKTYNPSTYQQAKTIEQERKAYEKALESCKTKDEVEQLKAQQAAAAVKRIQTIWKAPGLSREKKRELLRMEHLKAAALDDAMHEFTDSKEYEGLPDGIELQKGGKDTKEKENAALGQDLELGQVKRAGQEEGDSLDKAAKEAAEYDVGQEETEKEGKLFTPKVPADDAAEEGSIMRAILDEEARLAEEDKENASFAQGEGLWEEEASGDYPAGQAQAAYLASQVYTTYPDAAMFDVKK